MEFTFNVKVEASSNDDAKLKLQGAIDLMKAACSVLPVSDFARFAKKVKENPSKIKTAVKFL